MMNTCSNCRYFSACGDPERIRPCNGKEKRKTLLELEVLLEKEYPKYDNDCKTCPFLKECDEHTSTFMSVNDLAKEIKSDDAWDPDKLKLLCQIAGYDKEWAEANGETFEAVAIKAAEKLGVEIL